MTFTQQIIIIIVLYFCIYALITRICKCIEHCATARAYSKFGGNSAVGKMDDLKEKIENVDKK